VTMTSTRQPRGIVYAEDLALHTPYLLGSYYLDRDDVVSFASGLQTACIFQRLAVTGVYANWAIIAGKVIREMSFPRPVRPGSTLTGSVTITGVDPRSEQRSLVHKHGLLWDQDGNRVFSIQAGAYLRRRPLRLEGP
jgi:hypothetical protein